MNHLVYAKRNMNICMHITFNMKHVISLVWVKKNPPPRGDLTFFIFFTNSWEFLIDFLHTQYTFLSTLDHKFLFNYTRFWQSYATLSATTKFTRSAQNVHHWPKPKGMHSDVCVSRWSLSVASHYKINTLYCQQTCWIWHDVNNDVICSVSKLRS